jgi:hypothetical protein
MRRATRNPSDARGSLTISLFTAHASPRKLHPATRSGV